MPRIIKVYVLYVYHLYITLKYRKIRNYDDNGIYYLMIGEFSHIQHVLPLYKIIGGTVVVTSKTNRDEADKLGVKCLLIDDVRIDDLLNFDDDKIAKTIEYLRKRAKIIVTYDVIHFNNYSDIGEKIIFLSHGVSLGKLDLFWSIGTRIDDVKKYKYITSSDKFQRDLLVRNGIDEERFRYVTVARTSEVIRRSVMIHPCQNFKVRRTLGISTHKPIITYLPSLYAQNSVEDVGLDIVANLTGCGYQVLFWPHPHTDQNLIERYRDIKGVILARNFNVDLVDVCAVSNLLIVDPTTSVMTDAILSNKPIVFAYGKGEYNGSVPLPYIPMRDVVATSLSVNEHTVGSICKIAKRAISNKTNKIAYQGYLNGVLYNNNGDAVDRLADIIVKEINIERSK